MHHDHLLLRVPPLCSILLHDNPLLRRRQRRHLVCKRDTGSVVPLRGQVTRRILPPSTLALTSTDIGEVAVIDGAGCAARHGRFLLLLAVPAYEKGNKAREDEAWYAHDYERLLQLA